MELESVPFDFIDEVFAVMEATPQHTYLLLTKRPQRMLAYFRQRRMAKPCLPNLWLGTSVENQQTAEERLPVLLGIPAALHFASYEPALEEVDFSPWLVALPAHSDTCLRCDGSGRLLTCIDDICVACGECMHGDGETECPECGGDGEVSYPSRAGLKWIIAGGESGSGARPCDPAWLASVVAQCREAEVPAYVKQFGTAWARVNLGRGTRAGDPSEWPPGDWPREIPQEARV